MSYYYRFKYCILVFVCITEILQFCSNKRDFFLTFFFKLEGNVRYQDKNTAKNLIAFQQCKISFNLSYTLVTNCATLLNTKAR